MGLVVQLSALAIVAQLASQPVEARPETAAPLEAQPETAVPSPRATRGPKPPIEVDEDVVAGEPTGADPSVWTDEHWHVSPWERIVGEGARVCAAFEAEARAYLGTGAAPAKGTAADDKSWRRRARDCPHAVWVLRAAVDAELRTRFGFPDASPAPAHVEELSDQLRRSRRRMLRWLEIIEREASRVGVSVAPRDIYLAATAHAGLGRHDRARAALARAVHRGGASSAESHRLAALLALFEGDLVRAAVESRRAQFGGTEHDGIISLYVRALVLDRAGDSSGAAASLGEARRRDRSGRAAMLTLEAVLPVHERLYLRALERQNDGTTNAALRYWNAYLAHPAPTDAERQLASQHRAALAPVPEPVIDDREARPPPLTVEPGREGSAGTPPPNAAPSGREAVGSSARPTTGADETSPGGTSESRETSPDGT